MLWPIIVWPIIGAKQSCAQVSAKRPELLLCCGCPIGVVISQYVVRWYPFIFQCAESWTMTVPDSPTKQTNFMHFGL